MMRAKLRLERVLIGADKSESLTFSAVAANEYPESGDDENNTYAKFTPVASLVMLVNNPALHGKFKAGQEFYADFKLVEAKAEKPVESGEPKAGTEPPEDDGDEELVVGGGEEE